MCFGRRCCLQVGRSSIKLELVVFGRLVFVALNNRHQFCLLLLMIDWKQGSLRTWRADRAGTRWCRSCRVFRSCEVEVLASLSLNSFAIFFLTQSNCGRVVGLFRALVLSLAISTLDLLLSHCLHLVVKSVYSRLHRSISLVTTLTSSEHRFLLGSLAQSHALVFDCQVCRAWGRKVFGGRHWNCNVQAISNIKRYGSSIFLSVAMLFCLRKQVLVQQK